MKRVKGIVVSLLVVVFIAVGAIVFTWAQEMPKLSGVTVEDAHPNGCVDCHKVADDGSDYRMNVGLAEMKHPDVSRMVNKIPQDCAICHKAGTPVGAISQQTHKLHYENPSENVFVTIYGGECLACHAINTATGVMTAKSGPKNW